MKHPSFKILILDTFTVFQIVNRVNGIYSVDANVVIVIGRIEQKDPSDAKLIG